MTTKIDPGTEYGRMNLTLAWLRLFASRIRPEDLRVEAIPEVNDVKLVTDDDGLPTGWKLCPTCEKPYRHIAGACATCRTEIAVGRMQES